MQRKILHSHCILLLVIKLHFYYSSRKRRMQVGSDNFQRDKKDKAKLQ